MITKDWLLGFIEGEGSFSFNIRSSCSKNRIIVVVPSFSISQKEDRKVLEEIKEFLGKYNINLIISSKPNKGIYYSAAITSPRICFRLRELLKDLEWHTKKYDDFKKWSYCVDILYNQEQLFNKSKLLEIFDIWETMNLNKGKEKKLKYNKSFISNLIDKGLFKFKIKSNRKQKSYYSHNEYIKNRNNHLESSRRIYYENKIKIRNENSSILKQENVT